MSNTRIVYWLLAFIACVAPIKAQTKATLQFSFVYESNTFLLTDAVTDLDTTTHLQISDLKFYISKITLLKNKKVIWGEAISKAHLIDASNLSSQKITLQKVKEADELVFYLGIDSTTNVSGALGGDLDPTKGMYWTWQSGYINFKLEGKSKLCKTHNNEFQFHLGGYTQPYYCLEKISVPITSANTINIQFDIKKLLSQINLNQQAQIMSPCKDAVLFTKKVANCFDVLN